MSPSERVPRRPPLGAAIALMVVVIAALAVLRSSGTRDRAQDAGAESLGASGTVRETEGSGTAALPACRFGDEPAEDATYVDWRSTLLDTTFRLPRSYEPSDLVSVERAGFPGPQTTRELVIHDLAALRKAADKAGHPIDIIWGFRSFATQESVFRHSVAVNGYDAAVQSAARPGHSEHQLGTVFDFKTQGAANVYRTWESEPTGRWMAENAWRYGFIMSYPRGSEDETCYAYEPWHYRYFGRSLAAEIHQSGETTRMYLWTHRPGT